VVIYTQEDSIIKSQPQAPSKPKPQGTELTQELSFNLKVFSAFYTLICLETIVQTAVAVHGDTKGGDPVMLKSSLLFAGGIIGTVIHSAIWIYRMMHHKNSAAADCVQLFLAMIFQLPALQAFLLPGSVISPLKFVLWSVSIFLAHLIYLTIPFAKRGNVNRVFAITIQAIQLFYIGYLLNQYFQFTTGKVAVKVEAVNKIKLFWDIILHC